MVTHKSKNPRESANILSYCTFAWFIPTLIKGYRKPLEEPDLYKTLPDHTSSYLGDRLEEAWEKEQTKSEPSLVRAIWKVFGLSFISYGLIATATELIFKIGQGLSFLRILKYFSDPETTITKNEAYIYASILTVCGFCIAIGSHLYMFGYQIMGMKVRVACCSLIYRKSLKISKSSMGGTTIGHLVNLLTNDVSRFDLAAVFMNTVWLSPIQTVVILIIISYETGWTGTTGVVLFILCIPIQIIVGKKISQYRLKIATVTDERVRLMNEILSGIQVIKMYTWEKPFVKLIETIRKSEIAKISMVAFLTGIILAFINFLPKLGVFTSIIVHVLQGNVLDPMYLFSLVVFYNLIKLSVNIFFPQGIIRTAEALVSVKRIQEFLTHGEVASLKGMKEKYRRIEEITPSYNTAHIQARNATAKWDKKSADNTLQNINMNVQGSQLIAVVGPVGSGKSSLLNVILKELALSSGEINVTGSISYSAQEAWLLIATIKDNIVFGQPYQEERYKTVIKVCALERDLSLFPNGDLTLVGEKGANLSGGQKARINLARAVYRNADIYLLDDPLAAVDTHVAKLIFDECISKFLKNKCVVLVTNQLQFLRYVDYIYMLQNGSLQARGTYKQLQDSGVEFLRLLQGDDEKIAGAAIDDTYEYNDNNQQEENKEATDSGMVSNKVYKIYLAAGGKFYVHLLILLSLFIFEASSAFVDGFLSYWSNIDSIMVANNGTFNGTITTRDDHIYILSGTMIILVITAIISSIYCFMFFIQCSKNLHNAIFAKVISAHMRFFHLNPSGRILNRFSKDLGLMDDYLPTVIIDALMIAVVIIGVVVLVTIVNPWLCVAMILVLITFYGLKCLYLPTSIAIKRLEAITRSPVYTHMNTSLLGLATIRAFREQDAFRTTFDVHQDQHTSSWYMFLASVHTFGFMIDSLCALLVFIVTFSFFIWQTESSGGSAGLAITQTLMIMEIAQWCIRQWCEMTNNMTSVERIVEYLDIEDEETIQKRDILPIDTWPNSGEIEFKNVYLRYDPSSAPVLKNLTFKIKPKQKVGIVGRTGAGKSSLSLALFQLAYTEGAILIDGIDISAVHLRNLRSKIAIIPQEPVLFSETMRKNLDPFEEYDDAELWNALEEVELKQVVADMSDGLLSKMSEGGTNLSVGQRQLVCLARAIVRKNKILIMDEATANVDPKTDGLIQSTIRRKFADCSVLTIAHRLHTIIDSDMVLVMEAGEVKEFDHPYQLLQNKGVFYGMVKNTGAAMSDNLHQIAQNAYNASEER